nr:phosphopantetheine-binding protein [Streptomyces carpinensis]
MASLEGFLTLVCDELGLDCVGAEAASADLADLPGWDSLNLLRLVVLLEEHGRPVPVHRLLQARTLQEIYTFAKE